MTDPLAALGWDSRWAVAFEPHGSRGEAPGRIVVEHRTGYLVATSQGDAPAVLAGRLRHEATSSLELPTAGDWVALKRPAPGGPAVVTAVLTRRTLLARKAAGGPTEGQALAANVDLALALEPLPEPRARRAERVVALARGGGADAAIVLTKADLSPDPAAQVAAFRTAFPSIAVHVIAATTGNGLDVLAPLVGTGRTVALLGPSGAGKSTLANALAGSLLDTGPVRAHDARGQHTTTRRELVPLPNGGCLLDTPGLREIALWDGPDDEQGPFGDVLRLGRECRFRDCRHDREPGCAVVSAVAEGALDPLHLESLRRLEGERAHLERKLSAQARQEHRRKWRTINRSVRDHQRRRDEG